MKISKKNVEELLIQNNFDTNQTYDIKLTTSDNFNRYFLSSDYIEKVSDITFSQEKTKVSSLKKGDWIFIKNTEVITNDNIYTIDLKKYTDNISNPTFVFSFNDELKEISSYLNISLYAVKSLLSCEDAQYENHLPKLKKYIKDKYGIVEENDTLTSFSNLKKYALENFVFKTKRFLKIDNQFLKFLTFAIVSQVQLNSLTFFKNLFTNNEIQIIKNYLESITNSPIIDNSDFLKIVDPALCNLILDLRNNKEYFLNLFSNIDVSFLKYFLKEMENTLYLVSTDMSFLFSLKFLYQINNQCLAINFKNTCEILKDDFEKLDSTLITSSFGYYLQIKDIKVYSNKLEKLKVIEHVG